MKPPTFLVADDDLVVLLLMARMLGKGFPGATVVQLSDPDRIPEIVAGLRPDLIFLDWVFPGGKTGPAVCRRLKAQAATRRIPVILMTGRRTDLASRCKSVGSGADLFLRKPFTREEALGYARALLGRAAGRTREAPLRVGGLVLCREERSAYWGARPLPSLPPKLFDLLWGLARRSPKPVPVADLVRCVWRDRVRDRYVPVAIERLRFKFRSLPALHIESVPGAGYRLRVP